MMLSRTFLALASATLAAGGFVPHGTWLQPLSNYYVQTTSEVDWKCVEATFYKDHGQLFMVKTAVLHDIETGNNVSSVPVEVNFDADNNTMTLSIPGGSSSLDDVYDIREASEHLIVVTGRDSPSVFVWTTDLIRYYREDAALVAQDLVLWDYTNTDKLPQLSYTPECDYAILRHHEQPPFSNRRLRLAH
jgi:hypothetical protein